LFTIFNQKYKAIFLDPDSPTIAVDEKVNIILSPSLYWVKKLSLPVKYARDAKKLLPSIFEDTLPEGNYSYSVYKQDDNFFAFAYDDKVIIDTLNKKGLTVSNIASVYFAQSELFFLKDTFKINDIQSIYVKDGIVILLPSGWVKESGKLDLDELKLSKNSITLTQFGHIVDKSSFYKISAVLIALILLVSTELFITRTKVNELIKLKEELFTKSKLQATMFQNEAELKQYKKIDLRQNKIRDCVTLLLSLRLKSSESLVTMKLKEKSFVADFKALSKESIVEISKKLNRSGFKFKTESKEDIWHLEMVL